MVGDKEDNNSLSYDNVINSRKQSSHLSNSKIGRIKNQRIGFTTSRYYNILLIIVTTVCLSCAGYCMIWYLNSSTISSKINILKSSSVLINEETIMNDCNNDNSSHDMPLPLHLVNDSSVNSIPTSTNSLEGDSIDFSNGGSGIDFGIGNNIINKNDNNNNDGSIVTETVKNENIDDTSNESSTEEL